MSSWGFEQNVREFDCVTTLLPPTDLNRHHRHASCFPRLQLSPTKTLTGSSISQRYYGFCFEFFCVVFLLQFRAVDHAGYTSARHFSSDVVLKASSLLRHIRREKLVPASSRRVDRPVRSASIRRRFSDRHGRRSGRSVGPARSLQAPLTGV